MKIVILVLSDTCFRGDAADRSGPALEAWLEERGHPFTPITLLPDER